MNRLVPLLALLVVACGPSENDPGPGGVSVGEARALDEAAEMLEQQRMRPDDVPQDEGSTPEQPET